MKARSQPRYRCGACEASFAKWVGRCTSCGAWDSVTEVEVRPARARAPVSSVKAVTIGALDPDSHKRFATGIAELDRVLGGGAVAGGVVLVGGDPGVGKSTLLLQALSGMAQGGEPCLYVSGEESAGQTAARARRLGASCEALYVLAENAWESVEHAIDETKPRAVVFDSVQTLRVLELGGAAGTVTQLREITSRIVDRAKRDGFAALIVGHVTKDGAIAGPKVLEHLVDTVLSFEGERGHAFRVLRAQKNRFGSATEVGTFEMRQDGMREVENPSAFFLAGRPKGVPGTAVCATAEGSRAMLAEVQALAAPSSGAMSRRVCTGLDGSRLSMLLAVLERRAGLLLAGQDVFANVAGGFRIDEPAADLALALAVASSVRDVPVPDDLVAFGEVGLAGEVRAVGRSEARLQEASAAGFRRAIVPGGVEKSPGKIEVVVAHTVREAIELALLG